MPALVAAEGNPALVAPEVSEAKFRRELENWDANAGGYRRRGWLLVARGERSVEVAFAAKVPLLGQVIEVVAATVRIDFTNYDLWAPSVTFIDVADGPRGGHRCVRSLESGRAA